MRKRVAVRDSQGKLQFYLDIDFEAVIQRIGEFVEPEASEKVLNCISKVPFPQDTETSRLDRDRQAAWISGETGVSVDQVKAVLDILLFEAIARQSSARPYA